VTREDPPPPDPSPAVFPEPSLAPGAPPPDPAAPRRCLDCGAPLTGAYCAACGQRAFDHRVSLPLLLREVFAETLQLEGRLLRTVPAFLLRPGRLTEEFNAGRRTLYTPPLRLYLASSLLCLLALALTAGAARADLRLLDDGTHTRQIVADGETLYILKDNGNIWTYTDSPWAPQAPEAAAFDQIHAD